MEWRQFTTHNLPINSPMKLWYINWKIKREYSQRERWRDQGHERNLSSLFSVNFLRFPIQKSIERFLRFSLCCFEDRSTRKCQQDEIGLGIGSLRATSSKDDFFNQSPVVYDSWLPRLHRMKHYRSSDSH